MRPQVWKVLAGFQSPEAFGRFKHGGAGPAQRHGGVLPPFDVVADLTDGAVHVLDDVGAGQRPAQLGRQAEAVDGEDFVEALQDAAGDAGGLAFQAAGEVADQLFGLVGVVQFPSLAQGLAHAGVKGLGKTLGDVAGLVHLTPLDRGVATEGVADRLGQRLGAVDDEQAADRRVEAAPNQVVEQGLHHGSVLRRPLDHAERMFSAVPVDADCGQQHQVFLDVDAVDLDDQQVQLGQVGRHPFLHAFRR